MIGNYLYIIRKFTDIDNKIMTQEYVYDIKGHQNFGIGIPIRDMKIPN